jgi:hypothetical protein
VRACGGLLLKDWLKNEAALAGSMRGDVVEKYLSGNLWLRVCADLANGAKHSILDDRRRFDGSHLPETTLVLNLGFGIPIFPVKPALTIPLPPDGRIGAQRFVESCVRAWDEFLRTHGLLAGDD